MSITFCIDLWFIQASSAFSVAIDRCGAIGLLFFWHYESALPVGFSCHLFRKNSVFIFSNIATLINYSATFGLCLLSLKCSK